MLLLLIWSFLLAIPAAHSTYLPCSFESGYFLCSNKGITSIPQRLPPTVKVIIMPQNQISSISGSDFVDTTKLEELIVNDNKITKIDVNSFVRTSELSVLNVDDNFLSELNFYIPQKIRHINLKNNRITRISPEFLGEAHELEEFDVSQNQITQIPTTLFDRIIVNQQEIILDFSNNQITTLTKETIQSLIYGNKRYSKLKVNLSGNPLHCNCLMKWVNQLNAETVPHSVSDIDIQGTCASPAKVKGEQMSRLRANQFNCTAPRIPGSVSRYHPMIEHEASTVVCRAEGDPVPAISFRVPGGAVIHPGESKGRYSVSERGELTIASVRSTDGDAVFECIATNVVGSVSTNITVTVSAKLSSQEKATIAILIVGPLIGIFLLFTCLCCFCSKRLRHWMQCCRRKSRRHVHQNKVPVNDFRLEPQNTVLTQNGVIPNQPVETESLPEQRSTANNIGSLTDSKFSTVPRNVNLIPASKSDIAPASTLQRIPEHSRVPQSSTTLPRPESSQTVPATLRSSPLVSANGDPTRAEMRPVEKYNLLRKASHPYIAVGTLTNGITVPAKLPAIPLYIDPPDFSQPDNDPPSDTDTNC